MKKILFVIGTRPDTIKCAPLIRELRDRSNHFKVHVCATGQHREMLDEVVSFFELSVDYDLNIMKHNQTLVHSVTNTMEGVDQVISKIKPDYIIVQGDANPALGGSLSAYYNRVPIIHIEAGLRSNDLYSPYPEEGNRLIVSHLAHLHFAPTRKAVENLEKEGILKDVHETGNTVVDALDIAKKKVNSDNFTRSDTLKNINFNNDVILITGHRRENFGKPMKQILTAIRDLSQKYSICEFVYPVHLNPNVQKPVKKFLGNCDNIHLIPPLDYANIVWLMDQSLFIITDSGGIQEEAPSLRKPVIVTRAVTERVEGIEAGSAILVGSDYKKIIETVETLMNDKKCYKKMTNAKNPYGEVGVSKKIADIIQQKVA